MLVAENARAAGQLGGCDVAIRSKRSIGPVDSLVDIELYELSK